MDDRLIIEQIEFLMSVYGFTYEESKEYVNSLMDRRKGE